MTAQSQVAMAWTKPRCSQVLPGKCAKKMSSQCPQCAMLSAKRAARRQSSRSRQSSPACAAMGPCSESILPRSRSRRKVLALQKFRFSPIRLSGRTARAVVAAARSSAVITWSGAKRCRTSANSAALMSRP